MERTGGLCVAYDARSHHCQNIPAKDQGERQQEIGVCGGVILQSVDMPEILPKPSVALFSINPTFNQNVTAAQRVVFQQAINEWDALIDSSGFNPGNYPITFQYGPLNGSTLAQTTVTFNSDNGNLISAVIVFDNDGSTNWFEDPSPADDSEFQRSQPPLGLDLLSVARHEIGHAVGWSNTARVETHLSGNIFSQNFLNIATVSVGGFHADPGVHADDIMVPAIGASVRRPISMYPATALVSRAFHYWISTLRCVFGPSIGTHTGSTYQPWETIEQGFNFTPVEGFLLVRPRTYHENVPISRSTALEIIVIRGGTAVIGQ